MAGVLAISCNGSSEQKSVNYETLKVNFKTPPADIRTGVYWYWMNDNISVEGVEKDLEAMKAAGITKAFIGNIGGETRFPVGKVRIFTEQWWEVIHAALKKATELDIEIGMFNCPGWSQSGGPWIKTNQAMRYLNFVDTVIEGGSRFIGKLTPKDTAFEDVKVVAFPFPAREKTANGKLFVPRFKQGEVTYLSFDKAEKIRSLEIIPYTYFMGNCELQAKVGNEYKIIKKFDIDRSNSMLSVGWDKLAKVVITFPEVEAKDFRIIFNNTYRFDADFGIVLSGAERIERYPEKSLAKMFQTPLPHWDSYMWDRETTNESLSNPIDSVIDISDKLSADGTLIWDVPLCASGVWMVMRTGMSPTGTVNAPATPEGRGLEVDKMNKNHVAYHFDNFIGEVLRRIPAKDRKSLKYVIQDSYEMGGQNITDGFLGEFKKRYGYDMTPFLPVLQGYSVGSPDKSDRFLWDLRRLIADKISYDFVGGFAEVSHKNNLKVWLENYGHWGFPGEFLQYGGQSDGISGEFWAEQGNDRYEPRVAASCGHIYNKNIVSCESFTSGNVGYKLAPENLKSLLDWSISEGINEHILHVYIHQPYDNETPGIDAWFATEFNRHNTWFSQLDLFTDYIHRANYMMRQGLNVADVAYFIGEDAPKMAGIRLPKLPRGYNYDYINAEVILHDMKVRDGKFVLPHGTEYKVLVLPPQTTMRPELLRKIEQLVAAGGVIVSTQIPNSSPSLENYPDADMEVKSLAEKMWRGAHCGERLTISYEKGKIYHCAGLEDVFAELNIKPDFIANGVSDVELSSDIFGEKIVRKQSPVVYTHRRDGDREIYFVANQTDSVIFVDAQFRVSGKQPELWSATDGSVRPLPSYSEKDSITTVPLRLDKLEGYFIVFVPAGADAGLPAGTDANVGAGMGLPVGADANVGADAGVSVGTNASADASVGAGAGLSAGVSAGADVSADAGLSTGASTGVGVAKNFPASVKTIDISTDWTVSFQTDSIYRGVENADFAELKSWAENDNPQIKYYSGTALYKKTVIVPAGTIVGAGATAGATTAATTTTNATNATNAAVATTAATNAVAAIDATNAATVIAATAAATNATNAATNAATTTTTTTAATTTANANANATTAEQSTVYIEFENVCDMAKVKINGKYAGGCWTVPYRVNISGLLKEGENTVEVEVVNKWGNRLIGDAFLPFKQRKVRSYSTNWTPKMPLQASGLIGKVAIVEY
jgi:hypothetical protein